MTIEEMKPLEKESSNPLVRFLSGETTERIQALRESEIEAKKTRAEMLKMLQEAKIKVDEQIKELEKENE